MGKFLFNKQTIMQKSFSTIVSFLLLMCTTLAYGQGGAVTGIVTDSNGEPLIGVNVLIKGTMTGDITNIDGRFTIPQAPANGALTFSYVGYVSQDANFSASQRTVNVQLKEDSHGLDEVIVVGYGTRRAGEVTGAVATIKAEEISRLASVTQGEVLRNVPGVTVMQANTPGADATVRVRGLGTVNSTSPLWVIDGVPGGTVSPNDIETITVLKDAAAQAIYGTRAANGVILVTTKQGRKNQKASVTVNIRAGNSRNAKFYETLNTKEYGEMLWLQAKNANIQNYGHPLYGNGPTPDIPDYIYPLRAKEGEVDYSKYSWATVEEGGPGIYQIVKANKEGTDWMREVSRVAMFQDYSINVNGGSNSTTYGMTLSYLNQEGTFYYTGFDRLTLRSSLRTDVNKYLTIGQNLSASLGNRTGMLDNNSETSAVALAYRNQPIIPVYDVMGNFAGAGSIPGGATGNGRSPMELLWNGKDNNRETLNVTGSVFANLNIMEGLQFRTQASIFYVAYKFRDIQRIVKTFTERSRYDTVAVQHYNQQQWTWSNTLEYKKRIGLHSFELMAGTEAIERNYFQTNAARTEFVNKDPNYMHLSAGIQNQTNSSNVWAWALFSTFGRINYTFDSKYIVEGVIRRDGSSRFAAGNRYGVFPAFSLGWAISREKFMSSTRSWLDNLKLRGGWGTTGNDQMGDYNSYTTYDMTQDGGAGTYYMLSGAQSGQGTLGYRPRDYGVTSVKWETTRTTNLAVDAAFSNGLTLSFDVWYRKTSDMLYPKAIPSTVGVYNATPSFNVGEMENRGFDLDIGYKGTAFNKELRYQLSLNISNYTNKIISLSDNKNESLSGGDYRGITYTRSEAGHSFPEFYGYIVDGIFQTKEEADAHPRAFGATGIYNKPGHYKFRDVDGNGVINSNDRTWIGSPHPKFVGGMNFSFDYKGFDLNGQFYGSYGNKMANDAQRWLNFTQYEGARSKDRLYKSWGSPYLNGDNSKAKLIMAEADDSASQVPSTALLEDASYLRLRNMQLGYNLSKLMKNINEISSLRVYVQVTNIFTLTKYSGLNPEMDPGNSRNDSRNYGLDSGQWPAARQVMFGIAIGL